MRSGVRSSLTAPLKLFIIIDNLYFIGYYSIEWTIQWTILLTISIIKFMFMSGNKIVYPRSRLTLIKGKHYVIISVPAQMRHLFKGQRDKRLSTGTSDLRQAQLKQHDLAQQIYDEFDAKLKVSASKAEDATDKFAIDCITGLATAFNHKGIPDLKPSTDYKVLVEFKRDCDHYARMVMQSTSKEEKIKEIETMVQVVTDTLDNIDKIVELQDYEVFKQFDNKQFPRDAYRYAGRYGQHITHTFWQDLLIASAREQNLPEHRPETFTGPKIDTVLDGDRILPAHSLLGKHLGPSTEPISRPPRVEPVGIRTLSTIMEEYLEDMLLQQKVVNTKKKLTRWAKQFVSVMGDMELAAIKPVHGYDYIRKVLKADPDRSNQTLKDYLWGMQNLLKFCREKGYIDVNPFTGLDIKKYGQGTEVTQYYSLEELRTIFAHDWQPQERLLLSILATTGMRPSEAGNMTWERYNDTEHEGIRFFSMHDTEAEKVRVKNFQSKRQVPLHPKLVLPKKTTGRLFNYSEDDDGRCSTSIAHTINPVLDTLVPHPNKTIRSLRRTFKVMMRDLGVAEEIHDAITGHGENDSASRSAYGGGGLVARFTAMSRLDVSFLDGSKL